MTKKLNNIWSIVCTALVIGASSCESLMEPAPDNLYGDERILNDAAFAEGVLLNAYNALPSNYSFNEAATDDAVSNNETSIFTRIATGEWSSQFNPVSAWDNSYEQLYYLNRFLGLVPDIEWSWESEDRDQLFRDRFTGEALTLKSWYNFQLLQNHGGVSESGDPLGFVIITPETLTDESDDVLNLPRSTYDECVQLIIDDLDQAISLLPLDYTDDGTQDYVRVNGTQNLNRVSGRIAMALKARVLLYAASQSFYSATNKWADAADAAADLLTDIGGVSGLSPSGVEWYKDQDNSEIIWRRDFRNINDWEAQNFPPTLFGNGETNPSQNLVESFPMANGYPIDSPLSGYDQNDPYTNRDPRLESYIVYNGNDIGGRVVNTSVGSGIDGLNNTEASTRTGYYLKKLMIENVNLDPNINSVQPHFYTYFRYTEMFLIYAEAANEAWGPNADPNGHGFTAVDVVQAIRERAGITQPDAYLASVSASADQMRDVIRNERRLELCFEGFRFWDIRRWDMDLSTKARGMQISAGGNHSVIDVENRAYQPYMQYGPIPYEETLKVSNLVQNEGW